MWRQGSLRRYGASARCVGNRTRIASSARIIIVPMWLLSEYESHDVEDIEAGEEEQTLSDPYKI